MTKDDVLAILKNEEGYISGEKISEALGISRTSVNVAVKTLRKDGYSILSSTNKGYFLDMSPDRLTAGELRAYLPKERMSSVLCLESVDSTNRKAKDMAVEGAPSGQVVIANEQTKGKGRRGRAFASPKDKGIYLSMVLRPDNNPAEVVAITAWTAVAVSNAIQKVCDIRPGIKWVNDLVINQKKICGILTEMSIESESGHIQEIIIGIGINVNEDAGDFLSEIGSIATSIAIETGKTFSRAQLAAEVIKELDAMCVGWLDRKHEYLKAYREYSVTASKEVLVISAGGERRGIALAINEDFSLQVRFEDGTEESVSGGEVSVRGLYGYV